MTFQNVQKDPSVLTRNSVSLKEADWRSFDRKVGNIIEGDILTFSPNMNYLLSPPKQCRVCLQRDYHFGSDDPLYFPQPFRNNFCHLSLMLSPSRNPENPFYYAWRTPDVNHFCVINSSLGLGKLETVFHKVLPNINDTCINSLATNLRRFLDRLDIPGTREKVFVMVAQVQRCLLELNAQCRWVGDEWQTQLKDANSHIRQPLEHVIGAFTENLNDLDLLFYTRIPVWYIYHSQWFIHPDGFIVNCADASPPHKIIYDGLPNRPNCYTRMVTFLDSLLNEPTGLLGSEVDQLFSPRHSASLHNRGRKLKVDTARFSPYSKTSTTLPSISNTFLAPDSTFMPVPLQNWANALRYLSNHALAWHPLAGLNPSFSLPPARNILSPTKPETVRLLFHSWLRIHELILTQLNRPSSLCLTSKQWRCLLEVAGWKYGHVDVSTVTGWRHGKMRELLRRLLNILNSNNENIS
ncbi:hypothetical protein GYMLUDRAFT_250286 [Collybiopsis luxurians FD-317 M1]|uniref:Uncharacterized protein n=1 Tax=Collybiopsis luxurians FD-317 M1 TaxID=944289 RepID=A0A0D0BFZ8_9AGAR|nr:hypothetical protein GYMLUDRAFT_250286 [Collybiopsis luxurians FD-317 M1]